jgi:4-oxalocrotonate tautomerase
MPRIIIQALRGRSVEQKRELARRLTADVVEVFKVPADAVTIWLDEGEPENYARAGELGIDQKAS